MKTKVITKYIIAAIVIFIILLVTMLVLYATTDFLKPANKLFNNYFEQSLTKISDIVDISVEEQYIKTLQEKNYIDNTNITINYQNNIGGEEIFNISSNGSTNNQIKSSYRNMNISYNNNVTVSNIEFLQENNIYGVLFANMVGKFASLDLTNQDVAFSKLNINKDEINETLGIQKIKTILNVVGKNKESIKEIITTYEQGTNKNQFSKQKNKMITLNNGNSITTKAYILKFSGEDTRRLYRDILKQLGEAELLNKINEQIENFPPLTVTIYTENGQTVRTALEFDNNTVKIDFYDNELSVVYNENQVILNIKEENNTKYVSYQDSNSNIFKFDFNINQIDSGAQAVSNIELQTNGIKKIKINVQQKLQISDNVQIEKSYENVKRIQLDQLEESKVNNVLSNLFQIMNTKLQEIQNDNVNSELISKWIELNGKLQEKYQTIQNNKENRFNDQFLQYEGKNIEKNVLSNLLDIIGRNIKTYTFNEQNQLSIYLQEGNTNAELVKELKDIIEKSKTNYNVSFEFDTTGRISVILLEQYQKERN